MFRLIRREDAFFVLFEKSVDNAHQGARLLSDLVHDFVNVPDKFQAIKDLEHANDRVTHELMDRLNKTFITPLDREDIHQLSSRLDDVLDLAEATAHRLLLYKVQSVYEDAQALSDVLVEATAKLKEAVGCLRNVKKGRAQILRACVDVNTSENQGDRLFQHGLGQLFETSSSPIDVIKWIDLYNLLEENIDMCEDVANVIEAIVIKNT